MQHKVYLLWGIGDVVKNNPRVIQFILNSSIWTWPLGPPLGSAEIYISVNLLLLNIGEEREDVAVTVAVSRIDISNPLINVAQWSQMLVPLPGHPVLRCGVKMRMRLCVPELVRQYADRNFTFNLKLFFFLFK